MRFVAATALAFALTACHHGGGDGDPIVPDPPIDVSGGWRQSTVFSEDTCGTNLAGSAFETVVQVTQVDRTLLVKQYDECGIEVNSFSASLEGRTVNATTTNSVAIPEEPTCLLVATETDVLHLAADDVNATGGFTIAIHTEGTCSASLTCNYAGTLAFTRCPPASCAFVTCTPTTALERGRSLSDALRSLVTP